MASDKPESGPAPTWVRQLDQPVAAGEPTDAAIKILLQDQQFNFAPSADESYYESVVYIQTPQGLGAMGTISLRWKPDTDVVTVHKLHILRGGKVIDVLGNGQTFTVLRRENNLEYSALDGILTAVIQPAGLQVGDTLDFAFSLKRSDPALGGHSEQLVGGWSGVPISHVRVRARWARSTPMRWKSSAAIAGVRETRNGDFTEATLALDDIEPLVQPKGAPLRFFVDRQIEFSGFKSWGEAAKRLAPLYTRASNLAPQSPLQEEIARIRAASPDPAARAAAALMLVQDKIRYVFLGMNDGGLIPADADLTWSRRFGDCKAKTTLLLALLHAMDIDAQAVAVSSVHGDDLSARLPMIGWFDHVLVRAVINGKAYWLDGTRSGDRRLDKLAVPAFQRGLPLVENATDLIQMVPAPLTQPATDRAIRIDATTGIHVPAAFHVETVLAGDAGMAAKLQLANLTPNDLDRALRAYWSQQYDFVDIKSVTAKFDEQTGEERLAMDGSARMDWDDNNYETDGLGLGYKADFTRPPSPNHDAPFAVAFPTYTRVSETILLPNEGRGFTLEGDDIDRTVAGVEYRRHAGIKKGVFTAESSTRSVAPEFPATEAEAAQSTLRKMAKSTLYVYAPKKYVLTEQEVAAELTKTFDKAGDYIHRGNMLLDHGDYDHAIADFDKALAMNPRADLALADRAIAQIWKGNEEEAREDLDAAFAINPRSAVVFRGRGMLALNAANFPEAIAAFTKSLELDPDSIFALDNRARSYVGAGENEKALADCAEAIRRKPDSLAMYEFRAAILRKQGKPDEAVAESNAVTRANPDNARSYVTAGEIYASLKKDAEATLSFDRAVEIAPTDFTYLSRARYRSKTDPAGTLADIDAALKLNPASVYALSWGAQLQLDAGEYKKALDALNTALAIKGDDPDLLVARGIAYAKNGQIELAKKDFETGRSKAPNPDTLNTLCWLIATAGVALTTALDNCDAAIAKVPDDAAYLDSRGFVLLRLGRYDEAIAAYDSALKNQPTQPASLYGRGIAKRRKGDVKGGDADIQAALAANADVAEEFVSYGVTP